MTFSTAPAAVVVDASFAVEILEGDQRFRDVLRSWIDRDAMTLVPAHFWAETSNALLLGRRLPASDVVVRVERLAATGLETADRGTTGLAQAIGLAERHRLTVYDSIYLQLALDIDADLATLDVDLGRAARAEGLTTIT